MQVRSLPFWLMIVSTRNGGLARLAVAMISSRWPRPTGTIESMALSPVCTGWLTDLRAMTPGATFSTTSNSLRLDRALAVDGMAERVHDAADSSVPTGTSRNAAGALHRVALGDVLVTAQDHRADRIPLEVSARP